MRRRTLYLAGMFLLAALLAAAGAAACSGGKGEKQGVGGKGRTQTAIARTAAASTPTPGPGETPPPTSKSGLPIGGPGRAIERRSSISAPAILRNVEFRRISKQEAVAFTFVGSPPTIRVEISTDPPACGSSPSTSIEGAVAYLVVAMTPAVVTDFSGRPTLAATTIAGNGGTFIAGALTCQQESSLAWTFGLTRAPEFELGVAGDEAGVLLDPS